MCVLTTSLNNYYNLMFFHLVHIVFFHLKSKTCTQRLFNAFSINLNCKLTTLQAKVINIDKRHEMSMKFFLPKQQHTYTRHTMGLIAQ